MGIIENSMKIELNFNNAMSAYTGGSFPAMLLLEPDRGVKLFKAVWYTHNQSNQIAKQAESQFNLN